MYAFSFFSLSYRGVYLSILEPVWNRSKWTPSKISYRILIGSEERHFLTDVSHTSFNKSNFLFICAVQLHYMVKKILTKNNSIVIVLSRYTQEQTESSSRARKNYAFYCSWNRLILIAWIILLSKLKSVDWSPAHEQYCGALPSQQIDFSGTGIASPSAFL